MKGKRALVTGAGTGIGRGIALAFARQGMAVAVHYSHSAEGAQAVVKEIVDAGGKAAPFQADFAEVAPLQRMADKVVAFLGGLDVLVNNAGITMNRPFEKVTTEQFDRLYHVNVRAPFLMTQALLPELVKSRGAVINISSIHAYAGCIEHSVYAGTRGAIVSFTRQLAIELAPRGVRVNGIAPGPVPVDNHFAAAPVPDREAAIRDFGRNIPCGFCGTPDDIAAVALFLASPGGRYIVGQTLVVDGGVTSWMSFSEQYKEPQKAQYGCGYVPGL